MNILHLHTELNIVCGITRTIFLTCKYSHSNFSNYIVTLGGDSIEKFKKVCLETDVININRKSVYGLIKILIILYKFCKGNDIHIIHSYHRYFDFISYILAKIMKIRTITSVQSKVYGKKYLSYNSEYLIAISDSIKNHLKYYYKISEDKIFLINNFVEPSAKEILNDKESIRKILNLSPKSFIIGFVGRFNYSEKGLDILLKAFCKFFHSVKNCYLILIGKGEDENEIIKYVKRNRLPVKIVNATENIYDYYNIFDLFVLPSRIEPFGIVVIESGLMNIPFIGANVDGISEIIQDKVTGLLFEKNNYNDLLLKMKTMYENREFAKRCVDNLNSEVLNNYTDRQIIPKIMNLYNNLYKKNIN